MKKSRIARGNSMWLFMITGILVFLLVGTVCSSQFTTPYGSETYEAAYSIQQTAPNISVSSSSLTFGNVNVGRSSAPLAITIYNTGTSDLQVSSMTLSDAANYSINVHEGSSSCGNETPIIAPNSSCTVTVTFSPSSTGIIEASLLISSDDPDTPNLNVSLSGRGTIPKCGCDFFTDTTVIPRGGTLRFVATVSNNTVGTWVFFFGTKVTKPDGRWYPRTGYLVGPIEVTLRMSESKSKYLSLFIPNTAPLGIYTYHGYVGRPGYVLDECKFNFTVTE